MKHAPVVSDDVVQEAVDRIWNVLGPQTDLPDDTILECARIAAPGRESAELTPEYREELIRKVRTRIDWKLRARRLGE